MDGSTDIPPVPPIRLPAGALVVLVGPAGAGKSVFAARHFGPDEVLASDAIRAAVSGSEADQRASRVAFSILHRSLDRRLAAGRLTVVDATNVQRSARRALIGRALAAGRVAVAIVLDIPIETCLERNSARERTVPAAVVERQAAVLRLALDGPVGLDGEGFEGVHVLGPGAVDVVRIIRSDGCGR